MAEPAASQRGRMSALLRKMPSHAAFKLVEAVGLFAPISSLIDRTSPPESDERDEDVGRVSPRSLPLIWRWMSDSVAPDVAGSVVETFARAAIGGAPPPEGLPSMPKLRVQLGREGMQAFEHHSFNEIAESMGSRRAAFDALLVSRALAISEHLDGLRLLATTDAMPDSLIKLGRELAERDPECKSVFACAAIGHLRRTRDAAPLLLALVRRRDEHRLDRSDLAPALNAAIEVACARGATDLVPSASPTVALGAAECRSRDVVELAAALRGHVSDDWMRRLNGRLSDAGRPIELLCDHYSTLLRDALGYADRKVESAAAERTIGAAAFLMRTESVAATLKFEVARRRALGEIDRVLETSSDVVEERLRGLAQRDSAAAASYVETRTRLIELLQDERAARTWSRRGRRIIGRPTFPEQVLGVIEPVIADDGAPMRGGHLARDVVDAFWNWACTGPLADAQREAEAAFHAEVEQNSRVAAEVVAQFRLALAGVARSAADGEATGLDLGRPDKAAQVAVLAALLAAEPEIRARLEAWPPRLKHAGEQHVVDVRELHDTLTAARPEIEPSLLILVMGRLERPWQILRMLERIARTNSDTLIEATEFESIGEILIDRAEADAEKFQTPDGEPFNADRVLVALERFAGVASGMTEEFQIRRNGRWGGRFYGLKAKAARQLEDICRNAIAAIEAVTPRLSLSGGKSIADVARLLDESDVAAAVQHARFLRGSKVLDHRAAFAGARSNALSRIDMRLTSQVESLLSLAHAGNGRDEALAHLRALADVVGEFEGLEARDIVLRRAAAA